MDNEIKTYNESLEFALEYTSKTFKEVIRQFHNKHRLPISHEEQIILETIALNPGIIQLEIAKKISMQRSYVCKLLTKLEENNYITRESYNKSKRQIVYKIFLTDLGLQTYTNIRNIMMEEFFKVSTPAEREQAEDVTKFLFDMAARLIELYNVKF